MQNIPFALAAPGMTLAKPVMRPDSESEMPVCGAGTVLTESLIDRMNQMGIASLIVQGHPVVIEGEETPEAKIKALDYRFRRVCTDPIMLRLKGIYKERLKRLAEEWDGDEA
ncbi:MAG: hypothetical protein ACE5FZ_01325 [Nitrospiria bacterium]